MRPNHHLCFPIALLLFCACGPKTDEAKKAVDRPAATSHPDTLSFSLIKLHKTCGNCALADSGCAQVTFHYPRYEESPSVPQLAYINDFIQEQLSISLLSGDTLDNPESAAEEFIADYSDFISDNPPYITAWTWEKNIQRLYESAQILVCRLREYSFTGGAHGRQVTQYWNFDLETGYPISLSKLVIREKFPALQNFAEQTFRKRNGIPCDESLEKYGYWFEDDRFRLPENFGIAADTLTFLYNPYEIAAYAYGTITIRLPIDAIKDCLQTAWISP